MAAPKNEYNSPEWLASMNAAIPAGAPGTTGGVQGGRPPVNPNYGNQGSRSAPPPPFGVPDALTASKAGGAAPRMANGPATPFNDFDVAGSLNNYLIWDKSTPSKPPVMAPGKVPTAEELAQIRGTGTPAMRNAKAAEQMSAIRAAREARAASPAPVSRGTKPQGNMTPEQEIAMLEQRIAERDKLINPGTGTNSSTAPQQYNVPAIMAEAANRAYPAGRAAVAPPKNYSAAEVRQQMLNDLAAKNLPGFAYDQLRQAYQTVSAPETQLEGYATQRYAADQGLLGDQAKAAGSSAIARGTQGLNEQKFIAEMLKNAQGRLDSLSSDPNAVMGFRMAAQEQAKRTGQSPEEVMAQMKAQLDAEVSFYTDLLSGYGGSDYATQGYQYDPMTGEPLQAEQKADGGVVGAMGYKCGGKVKRYADGGEVDIAAPTDNGNVASMESGDYVIPVEALRFYGTKFFQNMIQKAEDDMEEDDAEGENDNGEME
jgi:hypothetical protein